MLKIENTYLCFVFKCVVYPWEVSYQPLDRCPAYSKPFYFQQRTIICSLFGVFFTPCDPGFCSLFSLCCVRALSWCTDKVSSESNPSAMLSFRGVVGEGHVLAGAGWCEGTGCRRCRRVLPALGCAQQYPLRCWGSPNRHGSGVVIKHPIRSEPFPSAPSPPAYSLLLSLFLVESFSYKWYLCNLARMF